MFLAGAITAGLLFFLSSSASSYEKAERNSIDALFAGFEPFLSIPSYASESGSITITPSSEALFIAPFLADIGSLTLSYEAIIENSTDLYALLSADVLGINASLAYWQLGQDIFMQLPGISDYYILLGDLMGMGDLSGFDFNIDYEELLNEIKVIGNKVLDTYFELTADVSSKWSEEVSVGELSRNADVFEIIIDEVFLYEIAKTGLEAFIDSDLLMNFARDIYNMENDYYIEYPWYQTFEEALNEIIDEIYDVEPWDLSDEELITMRVFISGKDVVKRDIIIDGGTISFSSITERNGQYACSARLSYTDWWGDTTTITLRDEGTEDKGYKTGQVRASYSDAYDTYSLTVKYEDVKLYDNGLFGGDIKINVPVEDGVSVDVSFKSNVTGDSAKATGSLSVFGMRIVDIEINTNVNTGKSISRPALNTDNTLDINNWEDSFVFLADLEQWAEGLGDLSFLEDLFYSSGLDSLLYGSRGFSNDWEYNWCTGEEYCWCDDCHDLWDWDSYWENYDWCTGDEYCWCDNCYTWDYDWDDDYDWDWDDCENCGGYHWGADEEYTAYAINSNKALYKILLDSDWSETLWNTIVADFGDCVAYTWMGWLEAYSDYGYDLFDIYYEVTDIIYSADWDNYFDDDDWFVFYEWNDARWESFYRQLLREGGFAF